MSKPNPTLTPAQTLKRFRQDSPDSIKDFAKEFNKMGINDRIELLFFMLIQLGGAK